MPVEIEKKYRLTKKQRAELLRRLSAIGAKPEAEEFEENTLYAGPNIVPSRSALRLRRVGTRSILTYKHRFPSASTIKRQQEEETEVFDPLAMDAVLRALGFRPALIYEKRRLKWLLGTAEIVIDDLPFGLFMEIEADPETIKTTEKVLAVKGLRPERETYPSLTRKFGKKNGDVIESRFPAKRKKR